MRSYMYVCGVYIWVESGVAIAHNNDMRRVGVVQ